MKRCCIFSIILCLMFSCIAPAHAATFQPAMVLDNGIDYTTEKFYLEQQCYVPVTILTDDALTGETKTVTQNFSVATITYKYEVDIDSGVYTGARFAGEPYPIVTAQKPAIFVEMPVAEKVSNPPRKDISLTDYTYSLILSGGLINITYTSMLHFGSDGKLIDSSTSTVQRTFYLHVTGP